MYINKYLSICYTNPDYEETRELAQNEINLINRGYGYKITYEAIIDTSQTPEYISSELEKAKEVKRNENKTAYDLRFKAGILLNGTKYDCDDLASQRIIGRLTAVLALNLSDNIEWFDFDYNLRILTLDEFKELAAAVLLITQQIEAKNCEFNIAIKNVQTIEELEAINIDYSEV